MNRAERRRARVRTRRREPGQDIAAAVACPDCNGTAAVVQVAPDYFRGVVEHDDTCPWYAALRRDLDADERNQP